MTTAGALAAEFARAAGGSSSELAAALSDEEAALVRAAACRSALPSRDRLAYDAVTLVVTERITPRTLGALFTTLARTWTSSPSSLRELTVVALMLGAGDAVARYVRHLAAQPNAEPALVAVAEATLASRDQVSGREILLVAASALGGAELARLDAMLHELSLGRTPASLRKLRPSVVLRELDRLLAPEFSLLDALAEGAFASLAQGSEGPAGSYLLQLLEDLGLPSSVVARLSVEERRQAEAQARALLAHDDPAGVPALLGVLTRLLGPTAVEEAVMRLERSLYGCGWQRPGQA